jgi:hypothetical protein
MSTEVQPPTPPDRSSARVHREKLSNSPPVAFNLRSTRRGHTRSSSFGGFVSRLLPSHRQEKGHTLRSKFNDDGAQDAGLVFDLTNTQCCKSSSERDRIYGEIKKSWLPRKISHPTKDAQTPVALDDQSPRVSEQVGQARRFSHGGMVGIPGKAASGQSGGDEVQITSNAGEKKKVKTLRRIIGSLKRARGEKVRERSNSEPSSQAPQILESKEPRPEETALFSDEKEITKTQQIYDDKKSRREQRRSLRESGDFLGVQGANPRTGYWDISDATSSSEPSQISETTKLRLDLQAMELAEQKKKYEEAQKSHQEELVRIQTLKELKKEKGEQKKTELKMRQRRHGKWRVSENGWSSVAEPELSPIQQSVAGTPVAGEF